MGTARTKREENTIKELLEFAGVPQDVVNEFAELDTSHPALKQAAKAKAAQERGDRDQRSDEQPKDYAEEEEDGPGDFGMKKFAAKYNDKQFKDDFGDLRGGEDGLGPDGDSRHDRDMSDYPDSYGDRDPYDEYEEECEMSYENEEEDWSVDYAEDTGMSATCPKCGSNEVQTDHGPATKDRVMAAYHECEGCGNKSNWWGPDAGLAEKKYGHPNESSESEEHSFDFAAAVKEAREKIEKERK